MPVTLHQQNKHLMWRAAFGPAISEQVQIDNVSTAALYKKLKNESKGAPDYINVAEDYLQDILTTLTEKNTRSGLSQQEKKMIRQKTREGIKRLNLTWLQEMVKSKAQLREKMAFFWHGHFACRNLNVFFQQQLLHVIRQHALGNFSTLLHEVSRSAAMLNFLNNNQNRKDNPNENFAREVMELFTMGRGHYTELDIKEAARTFTGWGTNLRGEFVFRKIHHDYGTKTILGHTGNFNGNEVLDILLEQKKTAVYITKKLYRFLVNEKEDVEKTEWLASRFYESNYDISGLVDDIFMADWFYNEKNIGTKIKSPIELLAGIQRILPVKIQNEQLLLQMQRLLGQVLFFPPNVAGWPGGTSWIDSSSLMLRMRFPKMLFNADTLNLKPKEDDDQMMGRKEKTDSTVTSWRKRKSEKQIEAFIDWQPYLKNFARVSREKLASILSEMLLQTKSRVQPDLITTYADESSREAFIKTATIEIMSTPEYQLC